MSVSSVLRAGPGHSTVQLLREDNTPFPIVNCKGVPCAVAIPGAVSSPPVTCLEKKCREPQDLVQHN